MILWYSRVFLIRANEYYPMYVWNFDNIVDDQLKLCQDSMINFFVRYIFFSLPILNDLATTTWYNASQVLFHCHIGHVIATWLAGRGILKLCSISPYEVFKCSNIRELCPLSIVYKNIFKS
jgi:hypothetical protein